MDPTLLCSHLDIWLALEKREAHTSPGRDQDLSRGRGTLNAWKRGGAGGAALFLTEPGKTGMVSLLSAPPFLLRCTPPPQLQTHPFLIIPHRDAVRTDERQKGEDPFPEAKLSYLCCHSRYDFILESVFSGPQQSGVRSI